MLLSPGTYRTPDCGIPAECGSGTDHLYLNCTVIQAFCMCDKKQAYYMRRPA